jgi:hypothetical protein
LNLSFPEFLSLRSLLPSPPPVQAITPLSTWRRGELTTSPRRKTWEGERTRPLDILNVARTRVGRTGGLKDILTCVWGWGCVVFLFFFGFSVYFISCAPT